MTEKYNGYANYPTWNICLWIDNTEGDQGYIVDLVREALEEMKDYHEIAEMLEEAITEVYCPEIATGPASDIFGYAWGMIEWYEVADNFIEAAKEYIDIDEDTDPDLIEYLKSL